MLHEYRWLRAGAVLQSLLAVLVIAIAPPILAAEGPAVENPQVGKALTEAKSLAAKKQWSGALAAVTRAEAVPDKSPYAAYKIDEFKGYILTQQRNYRAAAVTFEKLAGSPQASATQAVQHLKTAAQLYMQAKQNGKAAQVALQALKRRPGDPELLELAGNAQYLAQNYAGAVNTFKQLVSTVQKQGKRPEESWLQVMLNSSYKLNDRERIASAWELLLRYYPKTQYWERLIELKMAGAQSEPIELGYQRLMFDLGILKDTRDYEDLAMSSIDMGAPQLAVRVLQEGLQKGRFEGGDEARFQRMLEHARKAVAANEAKIAQITTQAQQARDNGQADVALGRIYLAQSRYDDAIAALTRGIEKGDIQDPDQARVDLGIAYIRSDELKLARQSFARVGADSQWHDLASLWDLYAVNTKAE